MLPQPLQVNPSHHNPKPLSSKPQTPNPIIPTNAAAPTAVQKIVQLLTDPELPVRMFATASLANVLDDDNVKIMLQVCGWVWLFVCLVVFCLVVLCVCVRICMCLYICLPACMCMHARVQQPQTHAAAPRQRAAQRPLRCHTASRIGGINGDTLYRI